MHEATEAYNYYSCVESEGNPRVKAVWERFLDYELGHVRFVADLLEKHERRDAAELLTGAIPSPIQYVSHRDFVRQVLRDEVHLRAVGTEIVEKEPADGASMRYRKHMNSEGSPTETVAAGWSWMPGGELTRPGRRGVAPARAERRDRRAS
jgi:hypothetical protein